LIWQAQYVFATAVFMLDELQMIGGARVVAQKLLGDLRR
jgi:hypothetical protein